MAVTLRVCRTPRTCRHCQTPIRKGDRFYDHNSRHQDAVCRRCEEQAAPLSYPDWLLEQGYESRADVPLTRRCEFYDRWFRWRCHIGHPPDKNWEGTGGNPQTRIASDIQVYAPARRLGARRPPEGWSAGVEKVG